MVSCGVKHVLYNLAQPMLNPGDEVIVLAPYWVSYPPIAMLAGAPPITVETREAEDFKVSPDALEEAITPRTKLLVLNSPSNPTGSVYTEGELETLAEVVLRHNISVVSDDIYENSFSTAKASTASHRSAKSSIRRLLLSTGCLKPMP